MIYLQNLAIPLYIGMAVWKPHLPGIVAIVLTEQFVAGFGIAGARSSSCSAAARPTRLRTSPSSRRWCRWPARSRDSVGPARRAARAPLFFTVAFLASIPSLILVWFVPTTPIEAEPAALAPDRRRERPSAFLFAPGAGAPSTSGWMRRLARSAGDGRGRGRVRLSVHARGAQGARQAAGADGGASRGAGRRAGARRRGRCS